jgi:Family of unknown function (DUF5906)
MKDDRSPTLDDLDRKYKVVVIGKHTRVLRFDDKGRAYFMDFRDFKNSLVAAPKVDGRKLADVWLEETRTYQDVIFAPGDKRQEIGDRLNLWHGWGVQAKKGEWDLIENHVRKVLAKGNRRFAEYVFNWVARMLQHPTEPGQTAIAFYSEKEGTGKSTFGRILTKIWGLNSRHISDTKHLVGHFNAHLQNCGFLFADEALWPGDKSAEGALKRLITEPTLIIEPKGVDPYEIANCVHLMLASNKEWIVPASIYARRFAVNEVSDKYVGDRDYWEALRHQINNGGTEAFFNAMLERDISDFDVFDIPQTKALTAQKIHSLEPLDDWWQDLLEQGRLPNSVLGHPYRVYTDDLLENLSPYMRGRRPMTQKKLGMFLTKRRCVNFRDVRRGWDFPHLQDARDDWAKQLGSRLKWDSNGKDWGED